LAGALVTIDQVETSCIILARLLQTIVPVELAPFALKAGLAFALEVINQIDAILGGVLEAAACGTIVDVDLALFALEAGQTVAPKVINQIETLAAVGARLVQAIVNVDLAVFSPKTGRTIALEEGAIIAASRPIQTRRRIHRTQIHFLLAPVALEAWRALAPERVELVNAGATIEAGRLVVSVLAPELATLVDLKVARVARETGRTVAVATMANAVHTVALVATPELPPSSQLANLCYLQSRRIALVPLAAGRKLANCSRRPAACGRSFLLLCMSSTTTSSSDTCFRQRTVHVDCVWRLRCGGGGGALFWASSARNGRRSRLAEIG